MHNDKYLRIKQVMERTGLSRPTIYNMIAAGTFPAQTSLGSRAVAWLESEVTKWMADRKTFDKTGREARPGRPPIKRVKAPSSTAKRISQPSAVPSAKNQAMPGDDDWGQDQPLPTSEEMAAIRLKLRNSKKPKNNSSMAIGFKKGPVVNLTPTRKK